MAENLLPFIPLRDLVIFPNSVASIVIDRKKSLKAAEIASKSNGLLILSLQKESTKNDPEYADLHTIGIKAKILQIQSDNDSAKIVVDAISKVHITNILEEVDEEETYLCANYSIILTTLFEDQDKEKNRESISKLFLLFMIYLRCKKTSGMDLDSSLLKKTDIAVVLDIICSQLPCDVSKKQTLLEEKEISKKITIVDQFLRESLPLIDFENELDMKISKHMEDKQKEFIIKEKIRVLQQELEKITGISDISELKDKFKNLNLSEEAKKKIEAEFNRYGYVNQMSPEAAVIRNYLEVLLSLPWGKITDKKICLKEAKKILDQDHYGLDEVKESILEYISAIERTSNVASNHVLLFVGPPGVGKTSLAQSIAKSLGREYVKCSLGGVHNEAEIRGHRRTYVGSMPGKIISALQKVNTDNPVILLDEIDKLSREFSSNPSAAFLEILDYKQNSKFVDNYLALEYDLSKVLFICSANSLDIDMPLLDRMNIIKIDGYTLEEKLNIANKHLLPNHIESHKIDKHELEFSKGVIEYIAQNYTREAGVRELDRVLCNVIRKVIRAWGVGDKIHSVNVNNIEKILGPTKYSATKKLKAPEVGTCVGLSYTEYGGSILNIEAALIPGGKGKLFSTGKLGKVMQESVETAFSYFKSISSTLGVEKDKYINNDIHIHFPEGAVPKDGPSAGVAIFSTIVSLMQNKKITNDIAMTGEISLRGKVLEIGGLKQKLLSAYSSDIKTVLIPKMNKKDLIKIPNYIQKKVKIVCIENAVDAIKFIFD